MKIALLTHSVNPRGGVVHTLELGEALARLGHDVTVMALATPGQELFRSISCRIELVPIKKQIDLSTYDMVKRRIEAYIEHLSDYLQTHPIDIFHAHDGIGANALVFLKKKGLIPHFVRTVHHLDVFENKEVQAWQSISVAQADRVLSVSHYWQEKITNEFKIPVELINNGVDATFFSTKNSDLKLLVQQKLGLSTKGPVVLCLGGVEERKNTVRVLKAFQQLHSTHPNAQLVIAGGASILDHSKYMNQFNEALHDLAIDKDTLSNNLMLTGPIPNDWMPSLMQLATIVVMASIKEGFGLVTLEALCAGTPIVVSKIKPFTEYLDDVDCTWADPLSIDSIESAMTQALQNSNQANTLRSAKRLSEIFSWDKSAHKHQSIYQSLLKQEISTCQ